jgi:hypothetical protein
MRFNMKTLNKYYELYRLKKELKKCHKLTIYFINAVKLNDKTSNDRDEFIKALRKLKLIIIDYIASLTTIREQDDMVVVDGEHKDKFIENLIVTISHELLNNIQKFNNKTVHEITKVCNSIAVDFFSLYKSDMSSESNSNNGFLWKSLDDSLNKLNRLLK